MISFVVFLYALSILVLWLSWAKIEEVSIVQTFAANTFISVVVAVRNEANGIVALLKSIEAQEYSFDSFEVIIVDDHSADATVSLVHEFCKQSTLAVSILQLDSTLTGKKAALTHGIQKAKGTLIVTTDGDCLVKSKWLSTINYFYTTRKVKMITGSVTFHNEDSMRVKLLQLEFAGLVASGAATLQLGYPTMCNGANLAFEKQAFLEVGGYEGTTNLASGDDEFLMHKIYRNYSGQVAYLKSKEALVETASPDSWRTFFNQRKRWSSKWGNYSYSHIKGLALLIFSANLLLLVSILLSFIGSYPINAFLCLLTLKIGLDFLFLRTVLVYFGRKWSLGVFMLAELIYPFYVVLFALSGRTGTYNWKGRNVK